MAGGLRAAAGLALLLAGGVGGTAAQGQDPAGAALATVETMFRAMKTRDTALLRSVFEPHARLVGIRSRPDGSPVVQSITVDEWVARVAGDPRPDWTERAFDPRIEVRGTLAQIWAPYDFHFGKTFSHCGVDSVQLLQLHGRWLITAIADTFEREGCPARDPPG